MTRIVGGKLMNWLLVAISLGLLASLPCLALEAPAPSKSTTKIRPASLTASPVLAKQINWQPWTDQVFERAKEEHKFVILDLEAVWCHWCHVMDEKTYSNPTVANLLDAKYIALRVDQDSRPDLSNKYEDFGWP